MVIDFDVEDRDRKITKREKKAEILVKKKVWNNKMNDSRSDPSPRFSVYYKEQCPNLVGEWSQFRSVLSNKLPVTFRYSIHRFPISSALLKVKIANEFQAIKGKYIEVNGKPVSSLVDAINWAANAHQVSFIDSSSLNQNVHLKPLSSLLVREANLGHICKQELVSMLPVFLLSLPSTLTTTAVVQSHHRILDVCASPGSKTDQLISLLYASLRNEQQYHRASIIGDGITPNGMIVANDADVHRIQTIRERYKRYNSPNLLVTCARAEDLHHRGVPLHTFNHIISDVPCSGDGTFRKSPHLWRNFRPRTGLYLHTIQLQIAIASIELLSMEIGSRFIYSTCSMNPLEDEAVVCAILRKYQSTLRLINIRQHIHESHPVSSLQSNWIGLKGLKWHNGMHNWRTDVEVMTGEGGESDSEGSGDDKEGIAVAVVGEAEDGVDSSHTAANNKRKRQQQQQRKQEQRKSMSKLPPIVDTMMPPTAAEKAVFHLDYSMRIFPHDQDTGGFYIAVFERYANDDDANNDNVATATAATATGTGNVSKQAIIPANATTTTATAATQHTLVSHTAEVSILKNICGFNPKQATAREDIERWRTDCNIYTYHPLTSMGTGTGDRRWMELLADGTAHLNNKHQQSKPPSTAPLSLYWTAHPYIQPDTVDNATTSHPAISNPTIAAEGWKGLTFAHKLQAPTASASQQPKPISTPVVLPSGPARKYTHALSIMSAAVKDAVDHWGVECIVQAGVEIIECEVQSNTVSSALTSDASSVPTVTDVRIIASNHNAVNYILDYYPRLLQCHCILSHVQDMIVLLQILSLAEDDIAVVLEELPSCIQEYVLNSKLQPVKHQSTVLCISYTAVSTSIHYGDNSTVAGEINTVSSSNNTNTVSDNNSHHKKRLSKHERKQLKNHGNTQSNISTSASNIGATAPIEAMEAEVESESVIDTERFHVLLEPIMGIKDGKSCIMYKALTPLDMCLSMLDVLSIYQSMHAK